jgi:hypothetical protein
MSSPGDELRRLIEGDAEDEITEEHKNLCPCYHRCLQDCMTCELGTEWRECKHYKRWLKNYLGETGNDGKKL